MEPSFTSQILSTLLALAIVGALAWVSLHLLKRLQQGRGDGGTSARGRLQFVHALSVGAKERVVVVSYAGEEWVLGVGAGAISLLGRLPAAQVPVAQVPLAQATDAAPAPTP